MFRHTWWPQETHQSAHSCTEPRGGVEGGSASLLPCWSFRVDGGAAEMVQGNFGTPYTCKLISVVPWSPWLCTDFPLPPKWDFIFWSWFQDHRDILNLNLPFCRDMQISCPPPSIASQALGTLARDTYPSFLQDTTGRHPLNIAVPDSITRVHLTFLHRSRSHMCLIHLWKLIFKRITFQ